MANTAVIFNGSSQYVSLPSWRIPHSSGAFTLEAWIKPTTLPTTNTLSSERKFIYSQNESPSIHLGHDGTKPVLAMTLRSGASTFNHAYGTTEIVAGQTYYVVATYDGTDLKLYVNGSLDQTVNNPGLSTYNDTDGNAAIGCRSSTAGQDRFFGGTIDEVAVWTSALTASQIADNYAEGISPAAGYPARIASLSPVGYWELGEASGTTATDSGSGGVNGTYVGSPTSPTLGGDPLVDIVPQPSTLPMLLSGSLIRPSATLPMSLHGADMLGMSLAGSLIRPAASLPMRLLADSVLQMSLAGSLIRPAATLPMTLETVLPRMTMRLSGSIQQAVASLPMRLITRVESTAAALGMTLRGFTEADITATNQRWTVEVRIDNALVERLVGQIEIQCEETASGTCRFDLLPPAGEVDPDDYERKRVTIDYLALNAAGVEQWRSRRFTGVTLTAAYDPDTGVMSVEGSQELQSWFEDIDPDIEQDAQRATISAMIGGSWSPHIFEESADNWRYAQDRLSTQQACIYIDRLGNFQRVAWAAKSAADIVLTDAGRFGNTLRVERPAQRDLVTRVRIGFDFRFWRLKQRDVRVVFNTPGFCSYLNQGWTLPSKSMIQSATDQSGWTRISDIRWTELPGPGTYCTPLRGWVGGADAFCLGASWTSAIRWAQQVTEDYTIDVVAPGLEDAIGQRLVAEDYGIEATYDASDFESIKNFDDRPPGATLLPDSGDWATDADDAEYDGRVAFSAAKSVAVAKAQTLIADRARGWRVSLECPWRPDVDIDKTIEVNTPYLECKGKVFSYAERLDIDTGATSIAPVIALSRHYSAATIPADPVLSAAAILPMRLIGTELPV